MLGGAERCNHCAQVVVPRRAPAEVFPAVIAA